MNAATRKKIKALDKLRLPELQEQFAEHVGETTRSPNRKYLIRRITEALETADSENTKASKPKRPAQPKTPKTQKTPKTRNASKTTAAARKAAAKKPPADSQTEEGAPLTTLSVAKLQRRYKEVVGRPTGSSHKTYLIWKIRQAQKGRIPVGPTRRHSSANPGDFKVIPLRMESEVVNQIDAARERLDLPSRTALIRRALMLYLAKAGENDVAALLEQGE